jgi:hypothetical protein
MFASHDFLYNVDSVSGDPKEPESGFEVYGNFSALNQVTVLRDWYTEDVSGDARPAYYDEAGSSWRCGIEDDLLSPTEIASMRHYQMIVKYDERVRDEVSQPPSLPRGGTSGIFGGITHWEQIY